ncbi:hypothetical protein ED5_1924 [Enterobacter roggenkampii]|nr:hypothetical protein ED5_1924 [Enterobacter roggenkampii]
MYQSWSHSFLVKVRHIIKTKRGKKLFAQGNIPLRKLITEAY